MVSPGPVVGPTPNDEVLLPPQAAIAMDAAKARMSATVGASRRGRAWAGPRVRVRIMSGTPDTVALMSTGPRPGAVPWAGAVDRLRGNRTRLVLTSGTLLFVELLLIRWVPSEVRYIGFFSNFLLMASFLGIGIGILLGRRREFDTVAVFPILLLAVVALITKLELNVQVRSADELFFGLAESNAADVNFLVLPIVFGLVTALMAPPCQRIRATAHPSKVPVGELAA